MHLRRFIALAALPLLAAAVVACDGGDDEATASPIVPTASITLTASPQPTESPTPSGTASDDSPRRSGLPEVDAIIEAVERRDMAAIAGLVEYQVVGCTHELGMGGPPKCESGQPEGEQVRVFPFSSCEGEWTSTALTTLAPYVLSARGPYAVVQPTDAAAFEMGNWPAADTLLVFHGGPSDANAAFRLNLNAGRVVSATLGCGAGAPISDFTTIHDQPSEVVAEWDAPGPPPPAAGAPSTGIEAVDEVLAAVARYDWPTLREGALDAMDDLPDVACQEEPLEGPGGVVCDPKNGETAGDEVPVFPVAYCEGVLARDPMPELRAFLDMAPALYAVVAAPEEPSQSELYPNGAYWLVYELQATPGDAQTGARLHVTAEGNVTALWFGCAPPVGELVQWHGEPLPAIEVHEE